MFEHSSQYSFEVRVEAASLALLCAEKHPVAILDFERDVFVNDLESLISERLHAFERNIIEQTTERLIAALKLEATL